MTWEATPKIACTVMLSRDFRTSNATGASIKTNSASVRARYAISDFWSAEGTVRYENAAYFGGRGDDFATFEAVVSYSPTTLVMASAGLLVENNNSNIAPAEFARNVLTLSASFRY